ncbi:hypothetical protein A3H75_01420 [Candidatus Uhrbacteria bacterium RIFCSPLOWO2_02_FULL_51_9]|uniref:Glycosyltransferase subfamily 4-like N-terminal domain-containing protein n=1 Tax=Candidatus Uhrbacteria bacterium RIFCSPLOWO2_02_FULL_51_9 TaxID=1802410 RepID=A0A1F7VET6_9BACT|nr:MAG: hypothetical protein A3H75_01420 [Candidatus Uhrbacteria bacterium RIFCSPLOWO2_02_FULL_51_9]
MKIVQVNKFYYPRGGADIYALALSDLLRAEGHEVIPFSMHHPENLATPYARYFVSHVDLKKREGFFSDLKKFGRIVYSFEARRKFARLLRDVRPDVVHVHNVYHQLSPSVLDAARHWRVPVVMTVHDYKLFNPNYSMFGHGGVICEHGNDGRFWETMRYNCMGSRAASFTVMCEAYLHRWRHTYLRAVRRFVSPSMFLINFAVARGWKRSQFVHLPSFVRPIRPPRAGGRECILYFGRLSKEKGLSSLLEAAKMAHDVPVVIAGRGPEEAALRSQAGALGLRNVTFAGFKEGAELWRMVVGARAVVVPTMSYENYPLSVIEAQSLGKIVIATRRGGLPEMVHDGENGFLVNPGDSLELAKTMERVWQMPADERGAMEGAARARVLRENDPADHVRRIVALYKSVLSRS